MDTKLEIVYYNKKYNSWYTGYVSGDDFGWNMSSTIKVPEPDSLKYRAKFYTPLKKYVEYHVAPKLFLNEKGVDIYIEKLKRWINADHIWVDVSMSNLKGDF